MGSCAWDLGINSLHVEDSSDSDDDDMDSDEKDAEYTENMPDMNTIRKLDKSFSDFAELDDGVKGKRTKLLSERYGLTQLNLGYDAMMADILHPYIVLTKRLQTKGRPILHRVRFWYSEFFRQMNVTFMGDDVDGPTWGKCWLEWISEYGDGQEELISAVKHQSRVLAFRIMKNVKFRIQPYWRLILASEYINPLMPTEMCSSSVKKGVMDMCSRVNMSVARGNETWKQLKLQQKDSVEMDDAIKNESS